MKNTPDQKSEDFQNLVNLLSVYTEASHRLGEMEANLNAEMMETVDAYKEDYAGLQRTLTEAEKAIELIAVRHYSEWFGERKSLKTPYGTVKFVRSTSIVVENEELSVEIIRRDAAKHGLDPALLIRTKEELNLEALETLTLEQLKAFKVGRQTKDNFSVVPAKVDLGKAVKEAAEQKAS